MKSLIPAFTLLVALYGCSDEPKGQWRVMAPVEVYSENDDGAPVIFVLQPGDTCALGNAWSYHKMFRFKRVSCTRGTGWISIDTDFAPVAD